VRVSTGTGAGCPRKPQGSPWNYLTNHLYYYDTSLRNDAQSKFLFSLTLFLIYNMHELIGGTSNSICLVHAAAADSYLMGKDAQN
jgi:hypothetical protein